MLNYTIEHTLRGLCLNISTPIFPFLWIFWVPCMHAVWVLTRMMTLAEPIWTHVVIIQPLSTNLRNVLVKSIIPCFRDDIQLQKKFWCMEAQIRTTLNLLLIKYKLVSPLLLYLPLRRTNYFVKTAVANSHLRLRRCAHICIAWTARKEALI